MDAGRELDALIAEQVMGMVPCDDPIGRCDGAKTIPCQCWGYKKGENPVVGGELSCYSTDIAAAWLVVKELRQSYDIVDILFAHHYVSCKVWKDFMIAEEDAETAPLAICLAALKAVGKGERI